MLALLKSYKRQSLVLFGILLSALLFTTCMDTASEREPEIQRPDGNRLVGSVACKDCHDDIYNHFVQTAHSNTSNPAEKKYIKGSFDRKHNAYLFNYKDRVFMADMDSGLYQVNFVNEKYDTAYKFGIVIGSGTRGQSYLYWRNTRLFQLPISYMTSSDSWSNSPGYPDSKAVFNRPIGSQCMGCHSSHVDILSRKPEAFEQFDESKVVYGVNCERCHGAGGKHVEFHQANANARGAHFIINASRLNQRQQLDACAVCHSSITKDLKPALGFATGDTLFHQSTHERDTIANLDVHGNQYGLLVASKCFRMSNSITCSTCHNAHNQERGELALFASRCMSCHGRQDTKWCKMASSVPKEQLISNCINCHMPTRDSKMLDVKLPFEENHKPAVIRTHFISIYPEDTKQVIEEMKKPKPTGVSTLRTKP